MVRLNCILLVIFAVCWGTGFVHLWLMPTSGSIAGLTSEKFDYRTFTYALPLGAWWAVYATERDKFEAARRPRLLGCVLVSALLYTVISVFSYTEAFWSQFQSSPEIGRNWLHWHLVRPALFGALDWYWITVLVAWEYLGLQLYKVSVRVRGESID